LSGQQATEIVVQTWHAVERDVTSEPAPVATDAGATGWIRRVLPLPSAWHMGDGRTSRGLVVAHCGAIFTDVEGAQTRPFEPAPSLAERCAMCQDAYGSRRSV
jgi:hypothetical protein